MPDENESCGQQIDRCRATIDQLRRELAQASAAAAAKSALLAELGHELRTPLSAIIGFAELMQSQSSGPIGYRIYRDYLEDIIFCGRHLLAVLDATVEITRSEAGQVELKEESVAVGEVVDETFRLISPMAEQGGVAILWRPGPGALPALYCDRLRLRQILLNIMSNAVKFTERGGRVEISADLAAGLALVVSDTGIGIEHIPPALSGLDDARPDRLPHRSGAGLGLLVAKALVEQHGGSLSLQSTRLVGTAVRIFFPAERVRPDNRAGDPAAAPPAV